MFKKIPLTFVVLIVLLSPLRLFAAEYESLLDKISSDSYSIANPFEPKIPFKKPEEIIMQPPTKPEESMAIPPDIRYGSTKENQGRQQEMTVKEEAPPVLTVTGLVWNSDRPQAIINGEVLDLGDTISNAKVISIRKTGVEVEFHGTIITINP